MENNLTFILDRGKKVPKTSLKLLVDGKLFRDMKVEAQDIVIKCIHSTSGHTSHMVMSDGGMRVLSLKNTVGTSIRPYLLGPNIKRRIDTTKNTDYRMSSFHTVVDPVANNTLVAMLKDTKSAKCGFRYYSTQTKMVHTVRCSDVSDLISNMTELGLHLPETFTDWVSDNTNVPDALKVPKSVATPSPGTIPRMNFCKVNTGAPKPKKSTATISVGDESNANMLDFNKLVDVPPDTPPMDVEISIPIPYTGMFVTIKVTTR